MASLFELPLSRRGFDQLVCTDRLVNPGRRTYDAGGNSVSLSAVPVYVRVLGTGLITAAGV